MSILSWFQADDAPEPEPRPSIPLKDAIMCVQCEVLTDFRSPYTCPSCGSKQTTHIERWLNRDYGKRRAS